MRQVRAVLLEQSLQRQLALLFVVLVAQHASTLMLVSSRADAQQMRQHAEAEHRYVGAHR